MKLGKLERQMLMWLWANREGESKRTAILSGPGLWGPHDLAEALDHGEITRSRLVSIVRAVKSLKAKGLVWTMRSWRRNARTRLIRKYFIVDGQAYGGWQSVQNYPCLWFALTPYGAAFMDTLGKHICQGKRLRHQMLQMVLECPILNVSCLGCGRVGRWNADEWDCVPIGYWHKPCKEEDIKKSVAATREVLKAMPPFQHRKAQRHSL